VVKGKSSYLIMSPKFQTLVSYNICESQSL
jgi:hypothetical protein